MNPDGRAKGVCSLAALACMAGLGLWYHAYAFDTMVFIVLTVGNVYSVEGVTYFPETTLTVVEMKVQSLRCYVGVKAPASTVMLHNLCISFDLFSSKQITGQRSVTCPASRADRCPLLGGGRQGSCTMLVPGALDEWQQCLKQRQCTF